MDTEQGRAIVAAHDNFDRALANIRNAVAMSTDDPRATELLESAGDAYAEAAANLDAVQSAVLPSRGEVVAIAPDPEPAAPAGPGGKAPGAEEPASNGASQQGASTGGTAAEGGKPPEPPAAS